MKKILFILFYVSVAFSRDQEKVDHIIEGNLALPTSQQPSPLFCFGQNIVDKGDVQIFGDVDYLKGKNLKFSEFIPSFFME